jgi:hypothetical protein
MTLQDGVFLLVPIILGVMAFRVSSGMGWHWVVCVLFALIPLGATLTLGVIGLLASAVFVGGLYKASA